MSAVKKRWVGPMILAVGILTVAVGIGLCGYNLWDDHRAGVQAGTVLDEIVRHREAVITNPTEPPVAPTGLLPDTVPDPDRELPVLEVDGYRYIGTISIPVIDVALPVQENWSLAQLKVSSCRYKGSPYQGDLILCAHNYTSHFGQLKNLRPGDEVSFTDVEGNEYRYAVVELETLAGGAVEEMESGQWDLTLFTCTLGGQTRVTVRCQFENGDPAIIREDSQAVK